MNSTPPVPSTSYCTIVGFAVVTGAFCVPAIVRRTYACQSLEQRSVRRRVEKQPFADVRHAEIAAFPQYMHDDYGETRPK